VTRRMHILVIDDYPLMAQALDRILQRDGHRVVVAASGREGLECVERAQQQDDPFAVVITDFSMIDLDGLAVAEAVKRTSSLTRVVLLTAYLLPDGAQQPPHVDWLLTKPPKLADLRAALADVSCDRQRCAAGHR
jgi:CheY-like chemotaxis protein